MSLADTLTLGEIQRVEQMARLPVTALGSADKPQGALMVALATVIKQRDDPKYRQADAELLTMAQVREIVGADDDADDPTPAPQPTG